ncbi:hypothetical protein [uncultured Tenacibaculum sp.]|uniref:hypothetical protein n=2 Tax=uncultured Tenacibaculum sp. TaxID=174713 RepID=UPI00262FCDC2|nr:hypothetical protein [uncultured Tenacibaculum sp.]
MNNRILTIIVGIIMVVGFGLYINVMMTDGEDKLAISDASSPMVIFGIVMFFAAAAIAVLASVLGIAKNPQALKKAVLGLGVLGVILLISSLVADSNEVLDANKEVIAEAGSSVSKLTSTGIWSSLILLVVGGAFFVFDLFKGLIK